MHAGIAGRFGHAHAVFIGLQRHEKLHARAFATLDHRTLTPA